MRRLIALSAVFIAAASFVGALVSPADARPRRVVRYAPPPQVWCLVVADYGSNQCTFYSRRQCMASRTGGNDACVPGARGAPTGNFSRW